ncbi:MAG: hypothetical protein NZ820_05725, partial [Dehalococcoidia bacterium]|nr:hypothetical protein [Dehalococcoidia bacterium]
KHFTILISTSLFTSITPTCIKTLLTQDMSLPITYFGGMSVAQLRQIFLNNMAQELIFFHSTLSPDGE